MRADPILTLEQVEALDLGTRWIGYWIGLANAGLPAGADLALHVGWHAGRTDAGHQGTSDAQAVLIAEWACNRLLAA